MSEHENGNGNGSGASGPKLLQGLRITMIADLAMITAMVTLVFWVGRQAERLDGVIDTSNKQTQSIEQIKTQNTTISGQVLQMTSSSNLSALEMRVTKNEARLEAQEIFNRDLKSDVVTRLNRIESKLDQAR